MSKTTIKKLTYLLMEVPEGGLITDDARLNYRVAREYVRAGVAQALRQKLLEDKNYSEDRDYLGNSVTEVKEVKEDPEKNYLYVDNIGESVDFGGSMKKYGLSFNNLHNRFGCTFVPLTRNQVQVHKNMKRVPNVITYYEDGDKLVLIGGVEEGDKISVTQSNVIPDNDDAPIPSDIGNKALELAYRTAYPHITMTRDINNDGVPNN